MGQGRRSEQYDTPSLPRPRSPSAKRASYAVEQEIETLRRALFLAKKETNVALQKFNQALEAERKAQAALAVAEDRRGELSEFIVLTPPFLERSLAPTVSSFMEYMSTNHHNMLSCEYPFPLR